MSVCTVAFAGLGVLAFIFFAWKVPEKKGHSLEEIETELGADADEDPTRARARALPRAT
jgi:hypothetical protein